MKRNDLPIEVPTCPEGLDVPFTYYYIQEKAIRYLMIGPDEYREGDPLSLPPEGLLPESYEVIASGCQQFINWRGLTPDAPLEDLGVQGFHLLMNMMHFEMSSQKTLSFVPGTILDQIVMDHMVTPLDSIVIHNLVKT